MASDEMPQPPEAIDALVEQICDEFLGNPGLRMTCLEARRRWGLNEPACRRAFEFLVEARFLRQIDFDTYVRLAEGPSGLGFVKGYRPGTSDTDSSDGA